MNSRKECPMRHTNGNCLAIGGFCTSVNDEICDGLRNAYACGASRVKYEYLELSKRSECSECCVSQNGQTGYCAYCPYFGVEMKGGNRS